jgi:anti-sigma B factor antagonist
MTNGTGQKKSKVMTQTVGDVVVAYFLDARILDDTVIQETFGDLIKLGTDAYKLKLLLNFSQVEYMSSAVLGKLVALHKKVLESKGRLKLCCIKPSIRQVFSITKLDKLFEIHDDELHALNAFTLKKF